LPVLYSFNLFQITFVDDPRIVNSLLRSGLVDFDLALRGKNKVRRDCRGPFPLRSAWRAQLAGAGVFQPRIVYLHPLVALWF